MRYWPEKKEEVTENDVEKDNGKGIIKILMPMQNFRGIWNNFFNSNSFLYKLLSWIRLRKLGVNAEYPVFASFSAKIKVGKNVKIGRNCIIRSNIEIGDGTTIEHDTEMVGDIKIGKYCAIARNVTFQGLNHVMNKAGTNFKLYREIVGEKLGYTSKGPIIVGNDVWIGTRVIVLSGVTIGDGAIVGAGAVVTKDVEPYEIVAGVPARHIKWRFPEHIRKQLLEIKWWNWDEEKIKRNKKFFTTDLSSIKNVYDLIVE